MLFNIEVTLRRYNRRLSFLFFVFLFIFCVIFVFFVLLKKLFMQNNSIFIVIIDYTTKEAGLSIFFKYFYKLFQLFSAFSIPRK